MISIGRARGRGRPSQNSPPQNLLQSQSTENLSQSPPVQIPQAQNVPQSRSSQSLIKHLPAKQHASKRQFDINNNSLGRNPQYEDVAEEEDQYNVCPVCERPNRILLCKSCGHSWNVSHLK